MCTHRGDGATAGVAAGAGVAAAPRRDPEKMAEYIKNAEPQSFSYRVPMRGEDGRSVMGGFDMKIPDVGGAEFRWILGEPQMPRLLIYALDDVGNRVEIYNGPRFRPGRAIASFEKQQAEFVREQLRKHYGIE